MRRKALKGQTFHVSQVWRISGDVWRDGQTASYRPCGEMKLPAAFTLSQKCFPLNTLTNLVVYRVLSFSRM